MRKQAGFTLLEVVVAMVLVGTGVALALTAVSGTAKLQSRMTEQDAATRLARSKLEEILQNPEVFSLARDDGEYSFAGTDYGYKVQSRTIPLLTEAQRAKLGSNAGMIEEISINVFWGPKERLQSYHLQTFRSVAAAPSQPSAQRTRP